MGVLAAGQEFFGINFADTNEGGICLLLFESAQMPEAGKKSSRLLNCVVWCKFVVGKAALNKIFYIKEIIRPVLTRLTSKVIELASLCLIGIVWLRSQCYVLSKDMHIKEQGKWERYCIAASSWL